MTVDLRLEVGSVQVLVGTDAGGRFLQLIDSDTQWAGAPRVFEMKRTSVPSFVRAMELALPALKGGKR